MIVTAEPFESLGPGVAYAMLQLRHAVFVVEQACPYLDLDGRDLEPGTRHVVMRDEDSVVGCARVVDDDEVWRIGRVALRPDHRGRGLADILVETALSVAKGRDVVLDAQSPLASWYATFGFEVSGEEFLEDGIPHLPMRLSRT